MIRKSLSILGIAILGSLAASGSAVAAQFKAAVAPVNYIGTTPVATPVVFSTSAGTATCAITEFRGSNNAANATAEMPISFGAGNCVNFSENFKSILSNGCSFKFTIGALISEGTIEVVCAMGKSIEIQKKECTVSIGAQKPLGNVSYKNSVANGKKIFEPTFEIKNGLNYTVAGAKCGTAEGLYTNGGITGTSRIAGEDPAKKALQDVWVE
ncbi:MAG: hypothetical protein ABW065_12915 [Solirubrobacterales bacterium]